MRISRAAARDRHRRGGHPWAASRALGRAWLLGPLLALVLAACGAEPEVAVPAPETAAPAASGTPRILLVAVDGFEWSVLLSLVQEGRAPVLRGLMERGAFGELESAVPTISPAIWTTVATAKDVARHGIDGFRYPDPENPRRWLHYTSLDRRTKAFWNILSDFGRRVHVVGWFVTYPAEPISGVMVAQANTARRGEVGAGQAIAKGALVEGLEGQVHPPERAAEMMAILHEQDEALPELTRRIFGDFPHPLSPMGQSFWDATQWAFRADATYARIASRLAGEEPPFDLLAVYLGGTDVVGHRFWRYLEPDLYAHRPEPEEVESLGGVIPDYYAYVDSVIGELLAASPEPLTVIVVTDHGMEPIHTEQRFPPQLRGRAARSGDHPDAPPGVFVAAGPGIVSQPLGARIDALGRDELPRVSSIFDITPTLLALLGVPVGADLEGRVLADLLDPAHLAAFPVQKVDSHDTPEWLAARPTGRVQPPDAAERTEQLRALGYID